MRRGENQMFKRALLAFTFVAALGAASLGGSTKVLAWGGCDNGYGYAYGYPTYYSSYYAPRAVYYPRPLVISDHHHHHHDRHHHSGLTLSFGF
jgi:hypothetical protein